MKKKKHSLKTKRSSAKALNENDIPKIDQTWIWVKDGVTLVLIKEVKINEESKGNSLIVYENPVYPNRFMKASLIEFMFAFVKRKKINEKEKRNNCTIP
jgi:hypothetical protein